MCIVVGINFASKNKVHSEAPTRPFPPVSMLKRFIFLLWALWAHRFPGINFASWNLILRSTLQWGEGVLNVQAFHWSTHNFIMILGRLICTCEISSDNRPKTISKSRVILYSIPHRMPSTLRRQGSGLGRLSERLSEVAVCKKSGAPISFCKPSKQNNKLAHVPSGNSGESVIKKNTL